MEKVIIVKGASNKGKTPTLHLLIDKLVLQGATTVHKEGYTPDISHDCFVILDIPQFGKAGIITYGDKGREADVLNAINICVQSKCRALFGASHMQYYKSPTTVYKILWDFGVAQNAKIVETTTLIKADGWGQRIDEIHLNSICAENLMNLLYKL